MPTAYPFGFPFTSPPPPPPPPPYVPPPTPAYYQSPLDSNFDDIQDYADAPGGRIGQVLPDLLGDRLLSKFIAKYPMTGTRKFERETDLALLRPLTDCRM